MNIDHLNICICTHNQKLELFKKTINSITHQEYNIKSILLIIIENSKHPKLEELVKRIKSNNKFELKYIVEEKIGLQYARVTAIRNSKKGWFLWVDDDNELTSGFISEGIKFIENNNNIGCFGGKLLLPQDVIVPKWIIPFLGYLGIKDFGDCTISDNEDSWTCAEPPGAGAWVHPDLLDKYFLRSSESFFNELGRSGNSGLASADDSLMMREAARLGYFRAYHPLLKLIHHIDVQKRFKRGYIMKLLYMYGVSDCTLMKVRGENNTDENYEKNLLKHIIGLLKKFFETQAKHKNLFFSVCMSLYYCGFRNRYIVNLNQKMQ